MTIFDLVTVLTVSMATVVGRSAPAPVHAIVWQEPASGTPEAIARRHLAVATRAFGLTDDDLADIVVTSELVSPHTGVTHVYFRQRHQGIEIVGADATVNIGRDGTVLSAPHSLVARVAHAVNATTPVLAAVDAVVAAARHLELPHQPPTLVSVACTPPRDSVVEAPDLSVRRIPARLVYHIASPQHLRLAWELEIERPDGLHWWVVTVDAATGDVLDLVNRVVDGAPARAR